MLPKPDDFPSLLAQQTEIARIPLSVAGNFSFPNGRQFVPPLLETPTVPEVTVNEDRELDFPKNEIGTTGQISGMGFEGQAKSGERSRYGQFRTRITTANSRHDAAPRLGRHDIAAVPARRLRRDMGSRIGFKMRTHRRSAVLIANLV
jgi:hypothetical protein